MLIIKDMPTCLENCTSIIIHDERFYLTKTYGERAYTWKQNQDTYEYIGRKLEEEMKRIVYDHNAIC